MKDSFISHLAKTGDDPPPQKNQPMKSKSGLLSRENKKAITYSCSKSLKKNPFVQLDKLSQVYSLTKVSSDMQQTKNSIVY